MNLRWGDIEARGSYVKGHEIVAHEGDRGTCYTLAFWDRDSEGYQLRFVGRRPFNVDHMAFFRVAAAYQNLLDLEFEDSLDD